MRETAYRACIDLWHGIGTLCSSPHASRPAAFALPLMRLPPTGGAFCSLIVPSQRCSLSSLFGAYPFLPEFFFFFLLNFRRIFGALLTAAVVVDPHISSTTALKMLLFPLLVAAVCTRGHPPESHILYPAFMSKKAGVSHSCGAPVKGPTLSGSKHAYPCFPRTLR